MDSNVMVPRTASSPVELNRDNGMLSGSAYPPLAKEYAPITIRPSYEQGAASNIALPASPPNSSIIHQPASSSDPNRYKNPQATAIPYKPMSPQQGGMTGYPPVFSK
jgi:hypothetical protein